MKTSFKHSLKQTSLKFMKEHTYRADMTIYFNLAINMIYAVFKAVCGIAFHSAWIGTLAFYYILLSVMRLHLVKEMKHSDMRKKWEKYGQCGWILMFFTIVIVGMSILMQRGKGNITYPGYLIYGVATYTFYAAVIAAWNINKYRKRNDPIYLANRVLNLAAAIVSVFFTTISNVKHFWG